MESSTKAKVKGFSLIEIMIAIAVVAILVAIAVPSYRYYIVRGKLPEAVGALSSAKIKMEQVFMDNRQYRLPTNVDPCTGGGTPPATSWIDMHSTHNFALTCVSTPTTFTLTAKGKPHSVVDAFEYTVDQANVKKTTSLPDGWTTPPTNDCWVLRRDGSCH